MDSRDEDRAEKGVEETSTQTDRDFTKLESAHIEIETREDGHGDGSDTSHVQWTTRQILATLSLAFLYCGSQLPLYFVSASLSFIVKQVGGADIDSWLPQSYALAFASLAPFSGYLQDVFGRRYISLTGGLVLCVGLIIVGTARTMAQGIVGCTISGVGAAIGELTALAGTSELVPVRKRGWYLGLVTGCILPFSPYAIYTTELGMHSTWRWGIWIALIWNAIATVGIAIFYFPQSQIRGQRKTVREILPKIDFIGALLSIGGLTLFLVGTTAGGYTAPWKSAKVLGPLVIGIVMIIGFGAWEWKGASFPMVPRELFAGHRIVAMSFLVSFVAGMYFYGLLNFFPVVYLDVYRPDPIQSGLKGVIVSLGVTAGAVVPNMLLSVWKDHNRWILFACAALTTAFGSALVTTTPENPVQTVALATVAGFGIGGVVAMAVTTAVVGSPDDMIATCVALSLSIRTVGGSVGTAIYSNIFGTKLKRNLPKYVATYAVGAGLPLASVPTFVELFLTAPQNLSSPAAPSEVPGLSAAVIQGATVGARWAYAESLKYVWYTALPFGVLSCVACLLIGNSSTLMTNRIAANVRR
ncbi:hypothetical protein AYO21_00696 [Fonsecaea monophora]|uniref:Major facilitator superfamily (MFS) profile domain-containing protein n=1 Tax=Fonsecaea monophora TaxID=254056 RepID=A0A177FM82_9EURO|nr:hypothetical protein AYO21_00696 [Fonsecaea monophora]OAG45348.1 hypothetical protein AYO21_00696 [Fonsecaea monophora]